MMDELSTPYSVQYTILILDCVSVPIRPQLYKINVLLINPSIHIFLFSYCPTKCANEVIFGHFVARLRFCSFNGEISATINVE